MDDVRADIHLFVYDTELLACPEPSLVRRFYRNSQQQGFRFQAKAEEAEVAGFDMRRSQCVLGIFYRGDPIRAGVIDQFPDKEPVLFG